MSTIKQALQRIAAEVPEARPVIVALLRRHATCECGDERLAGEMDEMFAGRKYDPGPGKQKPYGPPYKSDGMDKGKWDPKQKGKCFYETGDEKDRCYTTTNGGPDGPKPDTGSSSNREEYNKKYRKQRWDMTASGDRAAFGARLAELRAMRASEGMTKERIDGILQKAKLKATNTQVAPNGAGFVSFGTNEKGQNSIQAEKDAKKLVELLRKEGVTATAAKLSMTTKWKVNWGAGKKSAAVKVEPGLRVQNKKFPKDGVYVIQKEKGPGAWIAKHESDPKKQMVFNESLLTTGAWKALPSKKGSVERLAELRAMRQAKVLSKLDSLGKMQELEKKHGRTKAYYAAVLKELKGGVLAPSAVVGGGYKDGKKVAIKWLEEQMAKAK